MCISSYPLMHELFISSTPFLLISRINTFNNPAGGADSFTGSYNATLLASPGYTINASLFFAQGIVAGGRSACTMTFDRGTVYSKVLPSTACISTCNMALGGGGTVKLSMVQYSNLDYGNGCLFNVSQVACPLGMFCAGSVPASPCTAGFVGATVGQSSSNCSGPCSSGSYCPTGSSTQRLCPVGFFCPNPATIAPCDAGYFGSTGGQNTSTCSGNCTPGYFCPAGSKNSTAAICPTGSYCPLGSGAPILCPIGTFGNSTGLTTAACTGTCTCCAAGYTFVPSTCSQTSSFSPTQSQSASCSPSQSLSIVSQSPSPSFTPSQTASGRATPTQTVTNTPAAGTVS